MRKEKNNVQFNPQNENNFTSEALRDTSFFVKVKFQQNYTLQGEIHWANGSRKVIFFRSLLELIHLIEEAVDMSKAPKKEDDFRSWKNKNDLM